MIGNLYDKARYHKLYTDGEEKQFYYTRRGGKMENFCEMIGTRSLWYWLLPVPHYNRQYINFEDDQQAALDLSYMLFDKESLKELVGLEYRVEKKVEEDLIQSGFKLKRKINVPKYITQLIGKIE